MRGKWRLPKKPQWSADLSASRTLTKSPNHISCPGGDGPTGSTHSRGMREGFVYEGASQASLGSVNDAIHNRINPAVPRIGGARCGAPDLCHIGVDPGHHSAPVTCQHSV